MSIEYYVVFIGDRVYGYYASCTLESVRTRAYSDINSSELLRFEKIEKNQIPANEDIHSCDLDFELGE
jgi:hypothetical protein